MFCFLYSSFLFHLPRPTKAIGGDPSSWPDDHLSSKSEEWVRAAPGRCANETPVWEKDTNGPIRMDEFAAAIEEGGDKGAEGGERGEEGEWEIERNSSQSSTNWVVLC